MYFNESCYNLKREIILAYFGNSRNEAVGRVCLESLPSLTFHKQSELAFKYHMDL